MEDGDESYQKHPESPTEFEREVVADEEKDERGAQRERG